VNRVHDERHEDWLRAAFEDQLSADDPRRAELGNCPHCGPELQEHDLMQSALDRSGELERDVLAEISRALNAGELMRARDFARAQVRALAAGRGKERRPPWISLAAVAAVALCSFVAWKSLHSAESTTQLRPPRPQLGDHTAFALEPALRGSDGGLTLVWPSLEGAYEYTLELWAAGSSTPLQTIQGLDEPRCRIDPAQAAQLPAELEVRVQPFGPAGERLDARRALLHLR
jgi:hypothetical protein